jgi:hypothetical protein
VMKRRKNQNLVNIYITFWACLAQFITNMFLIFIVRFGFGKDQFMFPVYGLVLHFFNFNVLPFTYLFMSHEKVRLALYGKKYMELCKLLFEF